MIANEEFKMLSSESLLKDIKNFEELSPGSYFLSALKMAWALAVINENYAEIGWGDLRDEPFKGPLIQGWFVEFSDGDSQGSGETLVHAAEEALKMKEKLL